MGRLAESAAVWVIPPLWQLDLHPVQGALDGLAPAGVALRVEGGEDVVLESLAEPADELFAVTALGAGLLTILMGVVANYPFALAAGMGLNAVVAFQLILGLGLTWAEAMAVAKGDEETTRQIWLYSILMVALTLIFFAVAQLGFVYLAGAVILGGLFLLQATVLHGLIRDFDYRNCC